MTQHDQLKQKWASDREKLGRPLEDLLNGLFLTGATPFFDCMKVDYSLIKEFAKDQDAQFLSYQYIRSLHSLWVRKYPGATMPVPRKQAATEEQELAAKFTPFLQFGPAGRPYPDTFSSPPPGASVTNQLKDNEPVPAIPSGPQAQTTMPAAAPVPSNPPAAAAPKPAQGPVAPLVEPTAAPVAPSGPSEPTTALRPGQIPDAGNKPFQITDTPPSFMLPNCKVGVNYSAKIEGTDKSGRAVSVVDLRLPDDMGLSFDVATQMVSGQPLKDGEFELRLQWVYSDRPTQGRESGTCKLTATPDPWSLWNVLEPAEDLPYKKSHLDQKLLKGPGYQIAAASRRGRSHEHSASFRDDDFFIAIDEPSGWNVLIVADGAGSAKSSREGSRIAVHTAGKHLVDSLTGEFGAKISGLLADWETNATSQAAIGTEFHYYFHKMAGVAVMAIEQEAQAKGAPPKEYSTTLLAAAVKRDGANTFLATFWMGDGAIAAYGPQGTVKLMGTPDGGEFAGQTRFLDRNALADQGFGKRVKIGRWANLSSVMLMTDGVSDPYFETDNGLADPAKWDALWAEIQPQLADAAPELRLVDWLHFKKQGHHDDRTIALLW